MNADADDAARYRALLERTHDVITVVDHDGTVRWQSRSSEPVKGYSPEEFVGENVLEHVHPEDREAVAERMREMVGRTGRLDERVEMRFRRADGEWIWLASTGVNPGPDSPIEGYVVTSRDVTERKRAEREREREAERLDRFANAVSHDLRNPLNVAQAGVQALREGTGTDDEQVETVADALDRMETLVDDTLALARQGRTIGTTDPVAVAGVAERAWEVVPTEGATLEVADEVVVAADRERLRTVLENLFRNAVEHGGAGVTVRVGVIDSEVRKDLDSEGPKDLDSEGRVGLYVEDDGPGVSEADRERVFEAGYSTAEDGTGFGLAIAKEVVEAHGWGIRLTASEAGGARFELTGVGRAD